MYIKFSVIVCFILSSFCYGQKLIDLGIRFNSASVNKQKNEFDNLSLPNNSIQTNRIIFSTDLIVNMDLGKMRPRVWGGYYLGQESENRMENISNGGKREISLQHQTTSFRFGAGIGHVITLEDLKINIGPELMFFTSFLKNYLRTVEKFDPSGEKFSTVKTKSYQPAYYSLGLGVFTNAYYPLCKKISIGLELSSYFFLAMSQGDIVYEDNTFDANGTKTGTELRVNEVDYNGFNSSFLNLSIGFRYTF